MKTKKLMGLDCLRTFITLVVVAHHSAQGYMASAVFNSAIPEKSTAPIVDSNTWVGFDLFVMFNDIYFMSLMFLISGAVCWGSLSTRGPTAFLKQRFLRLGIPFVVVVLFLMPVPYYLSYMEAGIDLSFSHYLLERVQTLTLQSGPAWFIAVLLGFNVFAVVVRHALTSSFIDRISQFFSLSKPLRILSLLTICSVILVSPTYGHVTPGHWTFWGPFAVQSSRFLHYLLYFIAGIFVSRQLLLPGMPHTTTKLKFTGFLFGLILLFSLYFLSKAQESALGFYAQSSGWLAFEYISFSFCCAGLCLLFLYVSNGFQSSNTIIRALNRRAFGIYLIHYVFVISMQYTLLAFAISPLLKCGIVFATSLAASYLVTSCLLRVRVIQTII